MMKDDFMKYCFYTVAVIVLKIKVGKIYSRHGRRGDVNDER